ncbi:hypothetical protein [Photobacterium salinisoli]|uniref:hypothetical protein n=1 Tax=Photobacterium salinisoli TaxID=1616783 RepID=UPI0013C4A590|nr:hypothetical protein [Photobacterium salinisoli]
MSDGITGKATYKCTNCGAKHYLHNDDFYFEAESGSERGMGGEVQYSYELDEKCHNCDADIHLKFEVWEYPVGIINMTNEESSGAEIIESDFDIYHEPPREEHEEAAKLVKSLVLFKFDAFAEAFVEFWVKSYKRSPQPTAIISFISVLLASASLGLAIYSSEKARTEKLNKPESYTQQFDLLKNTEKNLNDLSEFISSKKGEIEATKSLIQELEVKRSELEPIVNANQEVVDAIFSQQRRDFEKTIWTERGISFGLGILASLIASIIWHFVGRFKKSNKQRQADA